MAGVRICGGLNAFGNGSHRTNGSPGRADPRGVAGRGAASNTAWRKRRGLRGLGGDRVPSMGLSQGGRRGCEDERQKGD